MRTTADILREAASYIEQRGWCRGEYEDREGHVCLVGAINRVAGVQSEWKILARGTVGQLLGTNDITSWNDRPTRTQAEVIETLLKAATLADGLVA